MQLAAASAWLSGRLDRPRMAALAPGIARLHASSKAKQHSTSISDPPETGSLRSRPIISFADAAASGRNQLKARGRGKTTRAFPVKAQPTTTTRPLRRKGTRACLLFLLWGRAVTSALRSVPGTGIADADRDGTWLHSLTGTMSMQMVQGQGSVQFRFSEEQARLLRHEGQSLCV